MNVGQIIFPDKSWFIQSGPTSQISQESAVDVTDTILHDDEKYVTLKEKHVGTDQSDQQIIIVSFKIDELPGYLIFRVSSGQTMGIATGSIDIDQFVLLEKDGKKSLRVIYRANRSYKVDVLYSRKSEFTPMWVEAVKPVQAKIFYAFPIDLQMAGGKELELPGSSLFSMGWKDVSLPLPAKLDEQVRIIDEAQQFLDAMDNSFSAAETKNDGMFLWNEEAISVENINKVAEKFLIDGQKPKVRLYFGSKKFETGLSAPVIEKSIIVRTRDGKLQVGQVYITF